jgi:hypothetical protein
MKSLDLRLPQPNMFVRALLVVIAILILGSVYIFQRSSLASLFEYELSPNVVFAINRLARLVINDFACFILIYACFLKKMYLKLAFLLFLIEILVIFPLYLALKLTIEGDSEISSPLLSQIHRLIVNPTLMLLLIAGFVYQQTRFKRCL